MIAVRIRHADQPESVPFTDVFIDQLDEVLAIIRRWGVVDVDDLAVWGQIVVGDTGAFFEVIVGEEL